MLILTWLFAAAVVHADPVVVSSGDLSCKIDQFSNRKTKQQFKGCAALLDSAERAVKSMEECKNRAIEKGQACLKRVKETEQVSVRAKLVEKLGVASNTTTLVCELDHQGGVNCP